MTSRAYLDSLSDAHPEATEEEKQLSVSVLYDEASLHARNKMPEEAIGSIRAAVAAGFRDFDRLRADPDWKWMLNQPIYTKDFDKLMKDQPAADPGIRPGPPRTFPHGSRFHEPSMVPVPNSATLPPGEIDSGAHHGRGRAALASLLVMYAIVVGLKVHAEHATPPGFMKEEFALQYRYARFDRPWGADPAA